MPEVPFAQTPIQMSTPPTATPVPAVLVNSGIVVEAPNGEMYCAEVPVAGKRFQPANLFIFSRVWSILCACSFIIFRFGGDELYIPLFILASWFILGIAMLGIDYIMVVRFQKEQQKLQETLFVPTGCCGEFKNRYVIWMPSKVQEFCQASKRSIIVAAIIIFVFAAITYVLGGLSFTGVL